MNRNKKTFTPNMRVAALYLLMGVLLLLAVTLFSGRESMRATEEYFDRTINFVKVQSTSYEKYNDTITAKSLRRMAVSVRQLAENDALDIYDPEALRKETESLWLTGIAVLDENGESLCEYTDGNIDYAQFAESLREQAALNVLQNPQKTYLKRILLQDGTAVDVATRRAAAGDAVLLAYRVTPPEFVEGDSPVHPERAGRLPEEHQRHHLYRAGQQGDRRKRPEPHRTVHHEQPAGAGHPQGRCARHSDPHPRLGKFRLLFRDVQQRTEF